MHSQSIRRARLYIKKRNDKAFEDKVVLVEDPTLAEQEPQEEESP